MLTAELTVLPFVEYPNRIVWALRLAVAEGNFSLEVV